ncbi:phenazine biosynthesis-like domain-containing protein 2 isoform X2 [Homarus americanus]|uniref:phenazine biosynthesis-like domain-containing protein 2 isoform X2 n=1 Tax=Homarus americanus TaxID=6706 RepID=UPI001C445BD0|nr:phenazine biosynthesis-like domain-containing protein 2 isoform X2 [Homarus americanus]
MTTGWHWQRLAWREHTHTYYHLGLTSRLSSRMQLQIYTVDAFSSRPFSGNPAAVVPLTQTLDEDTLQQVATELNLSETAYVKPIVGEGEGVPWITAARYSLRWFTPVQEIPLCGHATLATAHVLFHQLGNTSSQLEFETLSGVLVTRRDGQNIIMNFPTNVAEALTPEQEQQLTPLVQAATPGLRVHQVLLSHTLKYLLIRLHDSHSREELEALKPKYREMEDVHDGSLVMGVVVSVAGGGDTTYHAFSRFFAPLYGVDEDPVTGSAHTVLGPYWAAELGRKELNFRQCSKRGGDVRVNVQDDGRVDITGPATTVIQGHINV